MQFFAKLHSYTEVLNSAHWNHQDRFWKIQIDAQAPSSKYDLIYWLKAIHWYFFKKPNCPQVISMCSQSWKPPFKKDLYFQIMLFSYTWCSFLLWNTENTLLLLISVAWIFHFQGFNSIRQKQQKIAIHITNPKDLV